MTTRTKGWLPEGTTQGDLDDGDFAWLSDAYKAGDQSKSKGRKLPFKIHGTVNEDGWKAAWDRAHQMADSDFEGGPSKSATIATLTTAKPAGVEIDDSDDDGKGLLPQREYKTLAFKAVSPTDENDLQEGEFQGYAAAFGNVDGVGDIIEHGAFAKALADFLADGAICWQHDWSEPIGKPLEAREDDQGLFIKGRISQTVRGKDALTLLRDGVVTKMSIGYIVEGYKVLSDDDGRELLGDDAYDEALRTLPWWMDGVRVLTQIKLFEVSLVTVPANTRAVVTGVKDGLLARLTFDDHFCTVLAAERELITRVKQLAGLRAKEGRVLSTANRDKLGAMRDSMTEHVKTLEDLLALTAPAGDDDGDEKAAHRAAVLHEIARFECGKARTAAA